MAIGDIVTVDDELISGCHYVDTGMYNVTNYGGVYLLEGPDPVLVESGIGTNQRAIFELLETAGVEREELSTILLTHIHLDHAGGAGHLLEACPNATVVVHERGAKHLHDPTRLVEATKAAVGDQWEYYVEPNPIPHDRITPIAPGETFDIGRDRVTPIATPGHAHHHLAYYLTDADTLFLGDAAGLYDRHSDTLVPTTPPPEFDYDQTLKDIERLRGLSPTTLCYTHFGATANTGQLGRYRDVLADWMDAVATTLAESDSREVAIESLIEEHAPVSIWDSRKARAEVAVNAAGAIDYLA